MKHICILFSLFSLFLYPQNNGKDAFENYINYADVFFKTPEEFEQIPFAKLESFISHPNLHPITIMKFFINREKNVKIGFEVVPFTMHGQKIFEESQISECVLLDNYDVSQGNVLMYGNNSLKNYNADLHANYPVRLFGKYEGEYDFCREIYLQNNKKGRVIVLFFYNEEQRKYVIDLSIQFHKYLKFKE